MLTIDISKFHPKGKTYELWSTLEEMTIGDWEKLVDLKKNNGSFEDFLHEVFEIPKYQLRFMPRQVVDVIDANWEVPLGEAINIQEAQETVEGLTPFPFLPNYRYEDLETKMKESGDNQARFLKYMMAIIEGDYDSSKDKLVLEKRAKKYLDTPAVEALKICAFFTVADKRLMKDLAQYIPSLMQLLQPTPEPTAKNSMKDGGG